MDRRAHGIDGPTTSIREVGSARPAAADDADTVPLPVAAAGDAPDSATVRVPTGRGTPAAAPAAAPAPDGAHDGAHDGAYDDPYRDDVHRDDPYRDDALRDDALRDDTAADRDPGPAAPVRTPRRAGATVGGAAPSRSARRQAERRADRRPVRGPGRGRRTGVLLVAVAVLLLAVGGGAYYLYRTYLGADPDYTGPGQGDVVVQVADGDSTAAIGRTLRAADVVASVGAFLDAAEADDRIRAVQPGSYQMRSQMSAAAAVERLLDPTALVGRLEIRGGVQLDDTRGPDDTVALGVLSLVSEATCSTVDGAPSCVPVDDLRAAMADTDPAELGVPQWALDGVAGAEPNRRLEGLLAPGLYDVEPGAGAVDVLRSLLTQSASRLAPLTETAEVTGFTPYELLVIASLVEKEGITPDMPRVARVVFNRLAAGQRLELDSTVNYPLDLQALATTDADRETPGPYNTYRGTGLPPTPIAAVGADAIAATLAPEAGPWLYFVRCETDGTSCFAETFPEHQANIATARANGAF